MKNLARAVITAAAFLEFADNDSVNPDDAVRALEDIGGILQQANPEEITALEVVLQEEMNKQKEFGCGEEVLTFYRGFLQSFGVRQ